METKKLSYRDCVNLCCHKSNIILCNAVADDAEFQDMLNTEKYLESEKEIERALKMADTVEGINNLIDYYGLSINIDGLEYDEARDIFETDLRDNIDYIEFYQYFITSCGEWDIEYNQKVLRGALNLVYHPKLQLFILCVPHYGTSWDHIPGATVKADVNGYPMEWDR